MIILYAYETNTILVEPIKTRSDTGILHAYDVLYDTSENARHEPKLNIMENEVPISLKQLFQKGKTLVQLAPQHTHRINAAERSIHGLKTTFWMG